MKSIQWELWVAISSILAHLLARHALFHKVQAMTVLSNGLYLRLLPGLVRQKVLCGLLL